MASDFLGNPVTPADAATLASIDDFVGGFLEYRPRMLAVLAAAEAAPGHALTQTYAAAIHLLSEAPDAAAHARPFLARAAAAPMNAREQRTLAAVRAWAEDDVPRAMALHEATVAEHPRDLAAVKLAQYHAFNRGDLPALLRVALVALPASADIAQAHGMAAFGYEQMHLIDEAELAARTAIGIEQAEPWAHHALAHVYLTRGHIDEGIAFLENVADTWTGLNSFMHTHLWWHMALFRLSRGAFGEALRLYDAEVWGREPGYSQDQIGAVSLLARIELAGVDVGDRWADLLRWLVPRATDTVQPFLSMQYLYGLARAGAPEADVLMAAVATRAEGAAADSRVAWADAALPACEGLIAYARGAWTRAAERLGRALPAMLAVGGSHAQRDLFEQIHLDALLRSGELTRAQQQLELRRAADPLSVPLNRALARVYAALRLPTQADECSRRVAMASDRGAGARVTRA